MPIIRTNKEMEALPDEDYIDLVLEAFLEDGDYYCRYYGKVEYIRLVNVIIISYSCLIPLTDGSRWKFYDTAYEYRPFSKAANN